MQYILVEFGNGTRLYQEVQRGEVMRYCDMVGVTVAWPTGDCAVVDANPPQPAWGLPDTPIAAQPQSLILTRLAFRNRFTLTEKTAIYGAAKTVTSIQIWLDDLATAENVDLSDPAIVFGVHSLESAGLIAAGRAAEILRA